MLEFCHEFPLQSQIILGDFDQKTKHDFALYVFGNIFLDNWPIFKIQKTGILGGSKPYLQEPPGRKYLRLSAHRIQFEWT